MGNLAEIHPQRGLPRGRGSLPPDQVSRAQRERLLRAMTSAAAELGYANVRIADVVDRARVSRQSFYAQFTDKEQCFLAAHEHGVLLILEHLGQWADNPTLTEPRSQLRGAIGTYLGLVAQEPEFAHCMLVELQAIGPAGLEARIAAHRQIAGLLIAWHEQARTTEPGWPAVPASRYPAAVGAVHDLLFDAVSGERPRGTQSLEDDAVDAVLTLLQIPPA